MNLSKNLGYQLLFGASLFFLSMPATAQPPEPSSGVSGGVNAEITAPDTAGNIPPRDGLSPSTTMTVPTEVMIEPRASDSDVAEILAPSPCAMTGGLAENVAGLLPAFYTPAAAKTIATGSGIVIETNGGAIVVDGISYALQSIEIARDAAIPISSVQYPLEVRFVHAAQDGSRIIVSVPVAEGRANTALEESLRAAGDVTLDPNDFLPANRAYALVSRAGGPDCPADQTVRQYLLSMPAQASAGQIARLKSL